MYIRTGETITLRYEMNYGIKLLRIYGVNDDVSVDAVVDMAAA